MKKTLCSLLACILLLFSVVPMLTASAEDDPAATQPGVYFIYSDIQAEQTILDSSYGWYTYPATNWAHQLPTSDSKRGVSCDGIFYLAQNEREGMQIYFTEPAESASARNLRLEVSAFRSDSGEELHSEVFKEVYPILNSVGKPYKDPLYLADPLIPYRGEAVTVQPDNNQAFYVEVRSGSDQTPGAYYADVTYSDDSGVIATKRIAAVVWDFALPQQHYASMSAGLYNMASSYEGCLSFLKQCGVRTYTYYVGTKKHEEIVDDDIEKAEKIVEGWQEYLLDHGISPFEIPRFQIDIDEKAAELSMADIRRKYFSIPLLDLNSYNGSYDQKTLNRINQYKALIGDNDYLVSKAFFYTMDEVNPINEVEEINGRLTAANSAWQDVKRLITYNGKGGYSEEALNVLNPDENIVCIATATLNANADLKNAFLNDFPTKWRYPSEIRSGGFELSLYRNDCVGIFRRYPFWEQHNNNEDNIIYWNCAYYPNNQNILETGVYPGAGGSATNNGNGYFLYPGASLGEDIYTPIGSLRIKQIASGIDDADYLALADEFLPESDRPTWTPNYNATRAYEANDNRISLGNKLEKATIEHNFGEWHTVVEPDFSHTGLEIRECLDCGTEESRDIQAQNSHVAGHSVSIDGDIAVNFYMSLSDAVKNSENDPYMQFTVSDTNGEYHSQTVKVSEAETKGDYHIFKCRVAAKNIESEIQAQLFDGDDKSIVYTYSVKEYGDYLLSHTGESAEYAKAAPLVRAMLSYGAHAKAYFDEEAGALTSPDAVVPGDYSDYTINSLPKGVTFAGATLSLRSQTTLSLYFRSDHDIELSCDGMTVETSDNGKKYVIRIRNIAPKDLSNSFTVKIDGEDAVTYSPLTYCYMTQASSDTKLANTVKALYLYWYEAKEFAKQVG